MRANIRVIIGNLTLQTYYEGSNLLAEIVDIDSRDKICRFAKCDLGYYFTDVKSLDEINKNHFWKLVMIGNETLNSIYKTNGKTKY